MGELIIPKSDPPQLSPKAKEKVAADLLSFGLAEVCAVSRALVQERHPLLRSHLSQVVFERDGEVLSDTRSNDALRIGAALTSLAYLESGYDTVIADPTAFTVASLDAELEGIPQAYTLSYLADPGLQELMDIVLETPQMQDGAADGSYHEIVAVGAGLTRHFMQFAFSA